MKTLKSSFQKEQNGRLKTNGYSLLPLPRHHPFGWPRYLTHFLPPLPIRSFEISFSFWLPRYRSVFYLSHWIVYHTSLFWILGQPPLSSGNNYKLVLWESFPPQRR